jgi:hypothetical protein
MTSVNIHQPEFISVESLTQSPSTASRTTIVAPSSQSDQWVPNSAPGVLAEVAMSPIEFDPDLTRPRIPGAAKGRVLKIAADF